MGNAIARPNVLSMPPELDGSLKVIISLALQELSNKLARIAVYKILFLNINNKKLKVG
jgi:hypothetical protein